MSIVCRGSFFLYFIYPDLKKPVGFAVWKACLLITAVVTVIVLLCLANYGEGACRKAFADIADAGACQLYGRFSDQTGLCFCFGSGWHRRCCFFRVRCFSAPFWGRSYADRRKKSESFGSGWCLRLCLRCHFCPKASWRHSVCGLPFPPLAESGVSGGTAGFIALAWQEGERKRMYKNLFCWRWQSPFLTGCWDKKDPEDRAFIITLG